MRIICIHVFYNVQRSPEMCKVVQSCAKTCKVVQSCVSCAKLCKFVQSCAKLCKVVHHSTYLCLVQPSIQHKALEDYVYHSPFKGHTNKLKSWIMTNWEINWNESDSTSLKLPDITCD